jgi:hypothetical protein
MTTVKSRSDDDLITTTPSPYTHHHQNTETSNCPIASNQQQHQQRNDIDHTASHKNPTHIDTNTKEPNGSRCPPQSYSINNNSTTTILYRSKTHHPPISGNIQSTINRPNTNQLAGDPLTSKDRNTTLRIYFQNINGIQKNRWEDWRHASTVLKEHSIDIFGCSETNLAWDEPKRKHAQAIMKRQLQQTQMAVSSSDKVGYSDYQPGETTTCINGRWTGRLVHQLKDESGLGRWSGYTIIGNKSCHIAILTAYRPCKATGFNTSYQQQWRLLRNQDHPNPDPRAAFLSDLKTYLNKLTDKGYELILMWDANDTIHNHKSTLNKFMADTNLTPVHQIFPTNTYTTQTPTQEAQVALTTNYGNTKSQTSHHRIRIPTVLRGNLAIRPQRTIHRRLDTAAIRRHNNIHTSQQH